MEIKDYILDEEEFEKLKKTEVKQKKSCIQADYHVLFQSGCDFGIEKKVGKKISCLIILVSKGQYYISKGSERRVLTVSLLRNFLKELANDIPLPDVYWLWGICNDPNMSGRILKVLSDQKFIAMLKKGTIYLYSDFELNCRQNKDCRDNGFMLNHLKQNIVTAKSIFLISRYLKIQLWHHRLP